MAHAFTNDVAAEYAARRDALRARNVAAYEFLLALDRLALERNGFHVGTAENLHLYLDDRYLAYVRFESDPKKSPMMLLRAKPNIRIKDGTRDDSAPCSTSSSASSSFASEATKTRGPRSRTASPSSR